MLKKVNQIRRNLSKGSADKSDKSDKKESNKKKKSNQKVNAGSQTDETSTSRENVSKKLNFKKDKSKMNESTQSINNSLKVNNIPFIDGDSDDDSQDTTLGKVIEEPFPKTVRILETESGHKVYLVGTAHFSEESCKDIEYVIQRVKPDVVVVEICNERIHAMELDDKLAMEKIMNFDFSQAYDIINTNGLLQGLINMLFLYASKEITKQTKMLPGSEIRAALREARKIPHTVVQMGDRPLSITFKRAFGNLTLYQKLKFMFFTLFADVNISKEEIEKYKQHDILEAYLQEFGDNYPIIKKVLVDERDMFLAYNRKTACLTTLNDRKKFYLNRLENSRNDLAIVEQNLINCRHKLENFIKIKNKSAGSTISSEQSDDKKHNSDVELYETKLQQLENQYNHAYQQVIKESEFIGSLHQSSNNDTPTVVVGVVGMGHVAGIVKYFDKLSHAEIASLMQVPEPNNRFMVVRKVVKYSIYALVVYNVCKYALPNSLKTSVVNFSTKSVEMSKEFLNERFLTRK